MKVIEKEIKEKFKKRLDAVISDGDLTLLVIDIMSFIFERSHDNKNIDYYKIIPKLTKGGGAYMEFLARRKDE